MLAENALLLKIKTSLSIEFAIYLSFLLKRICPFIPFVPKIPVFWALNVSICKKIDLKHGNNTVNSQSVPFRLFFACSYLSS